MAEGDLRVLWATDGSEAARGAVPVLRQLVLPAAQKLVVLTVAPHSFLSGARPDPAFLTKITPAARRKALTESEQIAQQEATLLDPAIPVEAVSRWGNPIEEVLRLARTIPADLVVMGAKGHSNLGLILLGSVSQGVVQHATRPVLIARPQPEAHRVRGVLIGYDGSAPAKKAVAFLDRLRVSDGAHIHLIYVIEPFTLPSGTPVAYRKRAIEEAHKINESHHRQAERALATLEKQLRERGRPVSSEVLSGSAGPELDESARKRGADLIVVGSRKPEPLRHYLLGSTAEKLVRHSETSVLVVR